MRTPKKLGLVVALQLQHFVPVDHSAAWKNTSFCSRRFGPHTMEASAPPLRLVVWAGESAHPASRLPTLDPDSLYAASLVQARQQPTSSSSSVAAGPSSTTTQHATSAFYGLAGPSPWLHAAVPCLEHGYTGVVLAEGVAGIDAHTQRWLDGKGATSLMAEESDSKTEHQRVWARQHALALYAIANVHPLVHQVLFGSDLYYAHTARAYQAGLSLLSRQAISVRIRRSLREVYASRGRWLDPASGLGPILREANGEDEIRREETKQRDDLARRGGIVLNGGGGSTAAAGGSNPTRGAGSLGIGASRRIREETERAGRAFGQLRILSFAEEVFSTLSEALGTATFFSGTEKPAPVDVRLFSLLAPLLLPVETFPALAASSLTKLLRSSYPTLVQHAQRVQNHLWPVELHQSEHEGTTVASEHRDYEKAAVQQQDALPGTLVPIVATPGWPQLLGESAAPAKPSTTRLLSSLRSAPSDAWTFLSRTWSRQTSGGARASVQAEGSASKRSGGTPAMSETQRREARRLQIGRWVWIASAAIGIVGTAFASGLLAIEMVDDDDDDVDNEEELSHTREGKALPPLMHFERRRRNDSDEKQQEGGTGQSQNGYADDDDDDDDAEEEEAGDVGDEVEDDDDDDDDFDVEDIDDDDE